ncbi:MAG: hypothetical protein ACRD1P_06220 [Thermoanaerobaculia bacterium]
MTRLRLAQPMDVPAIQELIARSARGLSASYYTPEQTEARFGTSSAWIAS